MATQLASAQASLVEWHQLLECLFHDKQKQKKKKKAKTRQGEEFNSRQGSKHDQHQKLERGTSTTGPAYEQEEEQDHTDGGVFLPPLAKQNKTKQNKTKQNKTKQNKTWEFMISCTSFPCSVLIFATCLFVCLCSAFSFVYVGLHLETLQL